MQKRVKKARKELEHLRSMTAKLPHIVHRTLATDGSLVYEMEDGSLSPTPPRASSKEPAVAWTTVPPNSSWETHGHDEKEIVVFWLGKGIFVVDGEEIPVEKGSVIVLEPGTPHSFHSLTVVELIAITVPADERWPDAPGT